MFRRSSNRCARLYAARALLRSACASCSSIRSGCHPCSFESVDAVVRNPWPVISFLEKPTRQIAAFSVPFEIGRVCPQRPKDEASRTGEGMEAGGKVPDPEMVPEVGVEPTRF